MLVDLQLRFGNAVRSRRKHLGISQEELAGRAGLHRTYVADVERGARNLSLASIEKLAQGLDVSIPALFLHAGGEGPSPSPGASTVEILFVEDNPNDINLTLQAFEKAKLTNHVQVVRDGAEALEFLFCTGRYAHRKIEDRPRVVLLDLSLPKVNGLEVLRQIKSNERTSAIPVVVLTGSQRQQDLAESLQLGAEDYIVKPVDFNRFASVVPQLNLGWALTQFQAAGGA
jgi:CheY-like chemotaxis protein